jgi:hypothetical protein
MIVRERTRRCFRRRTGPGRRVREGGLCVVVAANSFARREAGALPTRIRDKHHPVTPGFHRWNFHDWNFHRRNPLSPLPLSL